jgi:DNA-binding NarL/FixJ family response regulator
MTSPTAPPLKPRPHADQISDSDAAASSSERMRILFFACTPKDAQTVLMEGNVVEIAYLPSHDMKEILTEIGRFAPQLIACQSDFFTATIQSISDLRSLNSKHQAPPIFPNGVAVSTISPREAKVLSMLVQGKTNNEIAIGLKLSSRTVKRTLSILFERFSVSNRTELSNLTGRLFPSIKKE